MLMAQPRGMNRRAMLLVLGLLVAASSAACSGAASPSVSPTAAASVSPAATASAGPAGAASTRRSEGGKVTVEATWAGPPAGAVFDIKLDTHSVDLDSIDLSDAVLRNDRGETLSARPWTAPKGGHHREGTLTFVGDVEGFFSGARSVELDLVGIGGTPERVLRWEIGP